MLFPNAVKKNTLTGAQFIIETLKNLGVDTIFGYPGGVVLSVYDALYKQKEIKHILTRHEQAAVHAAEGYARVSGKCGVVLVTSGPGASNTVTGIVNAYIDGYPLVVITGQVSSNLIGKDAFQEVNIIEMAKTCTKAGFQVKKADDIGKILKKAFTVAMEGKKGPVVVDIVKDIFDSECTAKSEVEDNYDTNYIYKYSVEEALKELIHAERPIIVSGGGVVHSKASKELYKLAKKLNIPVVSTMMGLGTFPQDDKNYFGMIGIFGQNSANEILKKSDLVLSIGARFNDRITAKFKTEDLNKKFIQIDINENEISRTVTATSAIVGDAKAILNYMYSKIGEFEFDNNTDWLESAQELKLLNKTHKLVSNKLQSFEVIKSIYEYTKSLSPYITTEVGQHQLWTAQNYKFDRPGQFITSGGTGTMGFGLPAAIGASIALNKRPVICIAGDGSFQMNEQELATCVDYELPIKIFIMNNGYLGMVRQLQEKHCNSRYSQTKITNPDFLKLAEAYGIPSIRVTKQQEIKAAVTKAFTSNTPYIIDFIIEPKEIV